MRMTFTDRGPARWRSVQVVTPPAALPLTLAEMKARLRVDHADEDMLIAALQRGAVAMVDGPDGIGVAMLQQTWRVAYDQFPYTFELPGWPVKSVASVNYLDALGTPQVVDAADYRADTKTDPAKVYPAIGSAWPTTYQVTSAVWVDYVLGEADAADAPPALVDAVALLTAWRYEQRSAGIVGVQGSKLPLGVDDLLAAYRRGTITA